MPFHAPPGALRARDQKSNRSPGRIQNNFHAIPPAIPTLINKRCAPLITKTHHPTSLTEGETMNRRHEGTEARRHEVVTKAARDQVRTTHPHSFPPRLVPTPCLSAFVPTCLVFPPSFTPARTKAHHPLAPACHEPVERWQNKPTQHSGLSTQDSLRRRAPRRPIHAKCAERTHVPSCHTGPHPPKPAKTRPNPPRSPNCKTNPRLATSAPSKAADNGDGIR
jgi:hypothetical protein